jgi:hypothetical protein
MSSWVSEQKWFVYSAGCILLATGLAKLISSAGSADILKLIDPIFGVQFHYLMLVVGLVEIAIALVCFLGQNTIQVALVACLATNFLVYRLGLWAVGWKYPCPCMGSITATLHVSPSAADNFAKLLMAYLAVGAYAVLALRAYPISPTAEREEACS